MLSPGTNWGQKRLWLQDQRKPEDANAHSKDQEDENKSESKPSGKSSKNERSQTRSASGISTDDAGKIGALEFPELEDRKEEAGVIYFTKRRTSDVSSKQTASEHEPPQIPEDSEVSSDSEGKRVSVDSGWPFAGLRSAIHEFNSYPHPSSLFGYPYMWYVYAYRKLYPEKSDEVRYDEESEQEWIETVKSWLPPNFLFREEDDSSYSRHRYRNQRIEHDSSPKKWWESISSFFTSDDEDKKDTIFSWPTFPPLELDNWKKYVPIAQIKIVFTTYVLTYIYYNFWALRRAILYVRIQRHRKRMFNSWKANLPTLIKAYANIKNLHRRKRILWIAPLMSAFVLFVPIAKVIDPVNWTWTVRYVQDGHPTDKSYLYPPRDLVACDQRQLIQTPAGQAELVMLMMKQAKLHEEVQKMQDLEDDARRQYEQLLKEQEQKARLEKRQRRIDALNQKKKKPLNNKQNLSQMKPNKRIPVTPKNPGTNSGGEKNIKVIDVLSSEIHRQFLTFFL